MENNTTTAMYTDDREAFPTTYDDLLDDVNKMEANSLWIPGIMSKDIVIDSIFGPLAADEVSQKEHMDRAIVYDTADTGTQLFARLPNGTSKCIRSSGKATLFERACIFGSALGRETPEDLASILNLTLKVAKGPALLLERYGKISAFHSDAGGGYRIMPISCLLKVTMDEMRDRFGEPVYTTGSNSHSYTSALWALPDIKDDLVYKYESAVSKLRNAPDISDMMPAVRFSASDTANSAAVLQPLFRTKHGNYICLSESIRVKHSRAAGTDGVELYKEKVHQDLFTRFVDSIEGIARLSSIYLFHPTNVIVSLCNKFRISKKCGETARSQAENIMVTSPSMTAYEVFLLLGDAIGDSMAGMGEIMMQEKLYTVMNPQFDWSALDVGGLVAWNNAAPAPAAA